MDGRDRQAKAPGTLHRAKRLAKIKEVGLRAMRALILGIQGQICQPDEQPILPSFAMLVDGEQGRVQRRNIIFRAPGPQRRQKGRDRHTASVHGVGQTFGGNPIMAFEPKADLRGDIEGGARLQLNRRVGFPEQAQNIIAIFGLMVP